MTYEDALLTLEDMRSRFETGFSSSDKATIENLYLQICGKRVRNVGCKDCWRDAYIETRVKLKQIGKMPKNPNYVLKAGAIIHPQGTSKFYSLNNIPDSVAEEWLGQYPDDINKFESYPTDWQSRTTARKEGKAVEPTADELKAEVARLQEVIADKDAQIEQAKVAVKDDAEVAELKAKLAEANAAIEKGKAEAQEEVGALNTKVETLEADLTAAKKEADGYKEQADTLTKEVARLQGELENALKAKSRTKATKE